MSAQHTSGRRYQVAIPIAAAERIAKEFGDDQIVIVGRRVGGFEHVTTYGIDKANCGVAARMGDFFKHKLMGWPAEGDMALSAAAPDLLAAAAAASLCILEMPRTQARAEVAQMLCDAIAKANGGEA